MTSASPLPRVEMDTVNGLNNQRASARVVVVWKEKGDDDGVFDFLVFLDLRCSNRCISKAARISARAKSTLPNDLWTRMLGVNRAASRGE